MDYPSIIVFLDNSQASEGRLDFALKFATDHNAHLTGLHLCSGPLAPFDPYGQVSGVALEWEIEVEKKQQASQQTFAQKAKNAGVNFDWDSFRDTEFHAVLARARVADLCVAGQQSAASDSDLSRNFYARLTMNLGKPMLFLPTGKVLSGAFEHPVVAWDGSRESTRAIADALPLLQRARQVSVITVSSKKKHTVDLPDVDIAAFLARHKVNVEVERVDKINTEVAEFILSRVDLKSADLLVMGAYGHSRFSEFMLGGMTRTMMKAMTVPVLMSH